VNSNREKWWRSIDENWDNLLILLNNYCPYPGSPTDYSGELSGASFFNKLRTERNLELGKHLESALDNLPGGDQYKDDPLVIRLCLLVCEDYALKNFEGL